MPENLTADCADNADWNRAPPIFKREIEIPSGFPISDLCPPSTFPGAPPARESFRPPVLAAFAEDLDLVGGLLQLVQLLQRRFLLL
jgi:hypothetical protein